MNDEQRIRTLVEQWASAVRHGDMDGVLAGHADDIVMYDVPPPNEGVRGLDAYRDTWPPFFAWQASGATFEIVSLEVTAGDDVAFAHALLRCGTPEDLAREPGQRLRLTLGLRKEDDQWVVAHEHHSFPYSGAPDNGTPDSEDARTVHAIHQSWFDRTAAKDLDGIMAHIAEDVVSYEHEAPLQYNGAEQVREVCRGGLDSSPGAVRWDVPDLRVVVGGAGDIAVAWGLNRIRSEDPDGAMVQSWSRGTRLFQKRDGEWVLTHQHVSFPFDPVTGQAALDLAP